jgi:plastocyanin
VDDAPPPEQKRSLKPVLIIGGVIVGLIVVGIVGVAMSSTSDTADSDPGPTSVTTGDVLISVLDYKYNPKVISVPRGASVAWLNNDKVDHTATDKAGQWDSTVIHSEESQTVKLDTPGTYQYYCTIHPYMTATITVRTDPPATPTATARASVDATPTASHN